MIPPQAYAGWRTVALASSFLQETRDGIPGERILQLVWQHQRLIPDRLRLSDGRCVRVLHPGFWNRGAGPDFRDAVIRIAGEPAAAGDVEIDLQPGNWRVHQHHLNPRYRGVILHVVWSGDPGPSAGPHPLLPLERCLDAPVDDLIAWVDLDPGLPDNVIGRCASGLRRLPEAAVVELLQQAALFRFRRKGAELAARARETGWEQALWEGLGAALGYQHNVWPMRRLAERRLQLVPPNAAADPVDCQARLLGAGGLLPHEQRGQGARSKTYLRRLWDLWWRERGALDEVSLPPAVWHLGAVRPANHPQRRLALFAHWLSRPRLVADLESWFHAAPAQNRCVASLLECLQVERDAFWSWHWTLGSEAMARPQPLLGETRVTDLAVNVLLPWFWVRAEAGGSGACQREAERRFLAWPAAQDNAILKRARMRLFAGGPGRFPWNAARQQGLLQVVRDFCGHSNALCDACALPERITAVSGSQPAPDPLRSPT